MAAVYFDIWILSEGKDRNAGQQVIHWLQEYLKREKRPAKSKNVEKVQAIIKHINEVFASSGTKRPESK